MAIYWLEEVNRRVPVCSTEEEAKEIIKRLYNQGITPREIIELLKMWTTAPSILNMLRKEGVEIRAQGGLNKINIDITQEQYINMSFTAIGKLYKVTAPTVKKRVEANPSKFKHLIEYPHKRSRMRWNDNG